MERMTQHGYLVLADISGYSTYVAKTELEHAHEVLSELLELIVGRLTAVLTLGKLEGDAVFAYVPKAKVSRAETLLELIETTYVAFQDRLQAIRRHTTCECNACRALPSLDLKFIAHHGDYIVQNVAGIHELVGTDVNLVHRLLKNHVSGVTGWRGYALFTEQCLSHMDVKPEGMHAQAETYDIGEVQTYSINLLTRYEALIDTRRVFITPEEADMVYTQELPGPPPIAWDWLNDPHKRLLWEGLTIVPQKMPGGRSGVGTRNHCVHGKGYSIHTVLDWRPFDYFTIEMAPSSTSKFAVRRTSRLVPVNGGTRLHYYFKFYPPAPKWIGRLLSKLFLQKEIKPLPTLARMLSEENRSTVSEPLVDALPAPVP